MKPKTDKPGALRKYALSTLCAFAAAFLIPAQAQAATTVTASTTTWSGDYTLSGNVTISSRIEVSGTATLTLSSGTLTAPQGIHVEAAQA